MTDDYSGNCGTRVVPFHSVTVGRGGGAVISGVIQCDGVMAA